MDNFTQTYRKLNREQREAVDQTEGPVLVLAGPGTGKTQLLSARVANILTKTDADPSSIVCLTFTVNAANNMRERLRSMIGPAANHVVIKTFHSLAADMIASHPDHFYAGAVLNPVSDLASQEIIQNIFESLPHDSPLASKYDDRYVHLNNAINAIGRVKDAGISPKQLRSFLALHRQQIDAIEPEVVAALSTTLSHKKLTEVADSISQLDTSTGGALAEAVMRSVHDAIAADAPSGKTTMLGKLKAKLLSNQDGKKMMSRERKANAWWTSLAEVYDNYQATLYKRGYLDYSDMLLSVIEALEGDRDLQLDIQESIQYLLIDEFQDSNQAQIRLAHLLVDNPAIDKPNIMVVGDPNQTIYGFNGAMLDNMSDFITHYGSDLITVNLTQNYRSSQPILDNSRRVIEPYSSFTPHLTAENPPSVTSVRYRAFDSDAEQVAAVSAHIDDIRQSAPDSTIAVLARGHASLSSVANYLYQANIAVNYEHSIDVRSTKANQLIITVMKCLAALLAGNRIALNHSLSLLIRYPVFAFKADDVWTIALAGNNAKDWATTMRQQPITAELMAWLDNLSSQAASQTLSVIIEQILSSPFETKRYLYQEFYKQPDIEDALTEAQATAQLLEIAKQYAQTDDVSIDSFLEMLDSANPRLFLFSPDTGHHDDAVTLMTVHGAKGLEFDHVILVDASEANWKPKAAKYPTPLSLPIHVNLETPADYARLLYVALTRAKQSVEVSYVRRIDAKTQALPAEQLADMPFQGAPAAGATDLLSATTAQLLFPRPQTKTMQELLANKLANYKLSATALTNFLDLSRGGLDTFIEDNLLKLPQPASDILAHGNAMHSAMELAQIQTNNGSFDLAAIKRLYAKKIQQENLTPAVVNRRIAKAEAQLDALFGPLKLQLDPAGISEQSVTSILSDNTALFGKIDRIDVVDTNTICVVDYKTGTPIEHPQSRSQDVLLKQWRHKLQLGFYVLLLKQSKAYHNKTIKAQIIQLDATTPEHLYLNYDIGEDTLAHIAQLARAVYARITSLDIPDVTQFDADLTGIMAFESWLIKKH